MNARRLAWRGLAAVALVAGLAALAGCNEEQGYQLYFSHYNHVEDYDLVCADCHGESAQGRFSSISHASCVDCHEDWMDPDKVTEKTCGECHKKRDLAELAKLEAPESVAPAAGAFVHTDALSNRCTECHGNLLGEKMTQVPALTQGERVRMRTEAHAWKMDCAACHTDMDPDTAPPNHDQNWMRRHGEKGLQDDNVCGQCHAEQSCRECHQEMMPENHNNLWRLKTHSIEAAWDRERCLVCHEEDSCTACHSEVRPQSHNAAWEKTHCDQCHPSSATGTGCAFCHETGIDDHPNPHPAGFQSSHCTQCHAGTRAGEQCGVCHGDVSLDAHPDPHPAGWQKNHCTQCHDGGIKGVSCEACHGGGLLDRHPNPHPSGWEDSHCNRCHESALGGVGCRSCHGGDLLDDHPNPHGPGYEKNHCSSCHAGSTINGVQCSVCHESGTLEDHPNPHSGNYEATHCNSCHPGSQAAQACELCHEGGSSVLVHEGIWTPVHDRFGDQADCDICH